MMLLLVLAGAASGCLGDLRKDFEEAERIVDEASARIVEFAKDEGVDQLRVTNATENADWGSLRFRADRDGIHAEFRADAGRQSQELMRTFERINSAGTGKVLVHDYLSFCAETVSPGVVIDASNFFDDDYARTWTFSSIAQCPLEG